MPDRVTCTCTITKERRELAIDCPVHAAEAAEAGARFLDVRRFVQRGVDAQRAVDRVLAGNPRKSIVLPARKVKP